MALKVHDADLFSVGIPADGHVCVVTTDARPDPASCSASVGQQTLPPESSEGRTLAMGAVWVTKAVPDAGAVVSSPATFTAALAKVADEPAQDPESATAYGKGMADSLVAKIPGAAPGPVHVDMQEINGLTVARVTVDVKGLPADSRILQHVVSYAVSSEEGLYSFTMTGSSADAGAVESFAAEVAATMAVAHPAAGRSSSYRAGYAFGKVIGAVIPLVFVLVVVVAILLAVRRRSSRPGA
jgi:hypothetical protein